VNGIPDRAGAEGMREEMPSLVHFRNCHRTDAIERAHLVRRQGMTDIGVKLSAVELVTHPGLALHAFPRDAAFAFW
jgi:hypothetical protein